MIRRKIEFSVPGRAVSFGTKTTRFGPGRQFAGTRKTEKAESWEAKVSYFARLAMGRGALLEGTVGVEIAIFDTAGALKTKRKWKRTSPDVDKVERLVLDAMTGVVYGDDAAVAVALISKIVVRKGDPVRVEVRVTELPLLEDLDGKGIEIEPRISFAVFPPPGFSRLPRPRGGES